MRTRGRRSERKPPWLQPLVIQFLRERLRGLLFASPKQDSKRTNLGTDYLAETYKGGLPQPSNFRAVSWKLFLVTPMTKKDDLSMPVT
jgi:hypothetical protein